MVSAYLKGASPEEAAGKFGYSRQACWGALRRAGVKTRTKSEARRKHPLDEGFFDSIDSEEKAYWLGFVTADGGVYEGRLAVNLKHTDRRHLVKLKKALRTTAPIRFVFREDGRKSYVLEVCSVRLVLRQ